MKSVLFRKVFIPILSVLMLCLCVTAIAGNIDSDTQGHKYAWGENIGWVNLEPVSGPGVTVTDTHVTGYAWAEKAGWIKMDPEYGGVVNDGNGNLSGEAWGETTGWISFSCEDSGTCGDLEYGVAIDPCYGTFSGCAWGEKIGWISFDSADQVSYKVATSWRLDTDKDGTPDCGDETPFGGTEGGGSSGGSNGICFISILIE